MGFGGSFWGGGGVQMFRGFIGLGLRPGTASAELQEGSRFGIVAWTLATWEAAGLCGDHARCSRKLGGKVWPS